MVTETFGPMLYFPESEKLEEFPTPESLKYRILISTKPPKEYLEAEDDKQGSSRKSRLSSSSSSSDDDDSWSEEPSRNGSYEEKCFKVCPTMITESYQSVLPCGCLLNEFVCLYVAVWK